MGEVIYLTKTNLLLAVIISPLWCIYYKKRVKQFLTVILTGVLFFIFQIMGYYYIQHCDIRNNLQDETPVQISGQVYQIRKTETSIYLYLKKCELQTSKQRYSGNCVAYMKREEWNHKSVMGKRIYLRGVCRVFDEKTNEGCYDEKQYYRSLGMKYKAEIKTYAIIRTEDKLLSVLYRLKMRLKKQIEILGEETYTKIYAGILLGDKSEIDEDVKTIYRLSGISHILSISGLHVSIIGYCIYQIVRRKTKMLSSTVISIGAVYLYLIMVGNGFSTRRAFVMFGMGIVALLIGRSYDMLSALGAAVVFLIVDNPYCILNTGLLLSCGAMIGIVFYQYVEQFTHIKSKYLQSLFVSVCVNLVTLPVLIQMNHEVPVYSVFLNVFIVTTVPAVIILGILAVMLSFVWLWSARFLFCMGAYLLRCYEWMCQKMLDLPYAVKIAQSMGWKKIVVYYLVLFLSVWIFYQVSCDEEQILFVQKLKRIVIIAGIYILTFGAVTKKIPEEMVIKMIDVGQGDSIYIESEGVICLIDAGSSSKKDIGTYVLLPFLKANGVERIDYLIMTHSDKDHCNGMEELLNYKYNGTAYVKNLLVYEGAEETENLKSVLGTARKNQVCVQYIKAGYYIDNGDMRMSCIWPVEDNFHMDVNNLSLVFRVTYKDWSVLFTGDIEQEAEEKLMSLYGEKLKSDLLKSAHHGSKTSSSSGFLTCVSPKLAIISVGKNNRYSHPSKETIDAYHKANIEIYRTDEMGEIIIDLAENLIYKYSQNHYNN